MMQNQDCPTRLVNTWKYGSKGLSREEWVKNIKALSREEWVNYLLRDEYSSPEEIYLWWRFESQILPGNTQIIPIVLVV